MTADVERRLGELLSARVAVLRRHAGLSLDRLAERSGLSKGTVVGIENGRANPSIGILCRLAAALSVSVSDLVDDHDGGQPAKPIERTAPRKLWQSANGGEAVLLAAISGATMFELWSWTLGSGETHASEAHSPGTAELIAVTSGTLDITVGGETIRLGAGETARLRTDQGHSYRAVGPETAHFAMAVLERDTSASGASAAPAGMVGTK